MYQEYSNCTLCPRRCGVNRNEGKTGRCHETSDLFVARSSLHYWEEPCISGTEGSGTIFFSGCNLGCVYCQNSDISRGKAGYNITTERLAELYLDLQDRGANNINLVTPTHYIPHIIDSISQARAKGLSKPIVYNTSGYELPESIRRLRGIVDIFLTDLRYMRSETAKDYSFAMDYPDEAKAAFKAMYELTGPFETDGETGLMKRGMVVRVLVIPGHADEACEIVRYLYETYGDDIYISLLRQYTPIIANIPEGEKYRPLTRRLTTYEYDKVVNTALSLGVKNAYTQEKGTEKESFIPDFNDPDGVLGKRENQD